MNKILCLDYDMTLFDHGTGRIPESALKSVDKIRDNYKIVLASGRYFNDILNQHIIQRIKPDAIIHANGCVVEADGEILHESFLDTALLEAVINFAYEYNFCLGSLYKGNWYSTNPQKRKESWIKKGNILFSEIKEARELYDKKIYSLFLDDTVETAALIEKNFPALRAPIMSEKAGGADIIPRNVSKAFGLQILLDYWHETIQNVAAIGDSMNDYELIQSASIGIAMGNAVSKIKEIADFVTTSISEDGIKNAIEYLES